MARADPTPAGFGRSVAGSQSVGKCGRNCEGALRARSQRRSSHRGVFVRHSDRQRSPSACDGVFQSSRLVFEERRSQSGRASDLSEAIGLEPDFAAALTKRGLLEERRNDLRSARADFAAVLKLPTTNSLSAWAHAMARERLAATQAAAAKSAAASNPATEAAAAKSGAASNPASKASDRATSEFWRRPLAQVLQECNAKPPQSIKLPGAKGAIELNRCYRGREHLSCIVAALLAEANSIKQDYADIVSVDYPNLKTLDSICQITPDRLTEHSKALQTFRERWVLLRKEYAARLECTNSVEESLRNMNLADMSYGADLVKSMVESFRAELTQV